MPEDRALDARPDADVVATIESLVAWFDSRGLAGFDPYDVYDSPVMKAVRKLEGGKYNRYWIRAHEYTQLHPMRVRSLLLQARHENSKSVGLLLGSWVRLTQAGLPAWPEDGARLIRWLSEHRHTDYPGASWSYPFGFHSRIYFPARTPWGIVTALCGEALLEYHDLTSDAEALDLALGAAVFIAEALGRVVTDTGTYIHYTPIDDYAIHNSSISQAVYLGKAAVRFDRPEWAEIAADCLRFTLSEQGEDGSFDYWAAHQAPFRHVDNYHTGFVLRALLDYSRLGYSDADEPLARGWAFYTREFEGPDGRPLTMAGQQLPVNIHGCAESILCGAALSERFPDALDFSRRAYRWTTENLRNDDGSFGFGVFDYGKQMVAYTRWNEAWMMRALSELALASARAE